MTQKKQNLVSGEEQVAATTGNNNYEVMNKEHTFNLIRRLYKDGDYLMSLLIGCCSFWGLRISDALTLSWDMISDTDNFTLIEKKTGKKRVIKINDSFQNHIRDCYKALGIQDKSEKCFADYSVQSINLILKEIKERYNLKAKHFNTQCLRRTFVCE